MPADTFTRLVLPYIIDVERGYSNRPEDRGGETKYGISKRSYPEEDIPNLTTGRAGELYFRDYWDRLELDLLAPVVALAVFDAAVQHGPRVAVRQLQTTLNELGGLRPLAVDGDLGPLTRTAANLATSLDAWGGLGLALALIAQRLGDYYRISAQPGQRAFLRGWVGRLNTLRAAVLADGV